MSESFSAADAADWTGARLRSGDPETSFSSVSIDTRSVSPGALFVAIKGPNHDAHAYLDQALAAGATGLLIQRDGEHLVDMAECEGSDAAVLECDDSETALGKLAKGHRARFHGPVLAITGSNGKTTTKEMVAAVLCELAPCLKTQGNLNNQFGLPLTLLQREREHEIAVVELGMNHRGEIAALAQIAAPTIGLVTNVGTAHIEFLHTQEAIAQEKGDLFAALPSDGVAVVNRDDPRVLSQANRAACRQITYGLSAAADVSAENIRFEAPGSYHFDVRTPQGRIAVKLTGLAETSVINGLAAAAAGIAAGASLANVASGLANYRPEAGRMSPRELGNDVTLIDDSYNANPQSMRAALETLARLCSPGRGIAVLGDMGELGESAEREHAEVGRSAAELGIDLLVWLGERSDTVMQAARDAGMNASRLASGKTHAEVAGLVRDALEPHDWVLVKGSRGMHMERVIEALSPKESR